MKVTRQDVAKLAGVSTATISYVINNGPRPVSEETRKRILDAIEQLNYKPNRLARGLTTGRTQSIGFIIPDISDPFFPELILGAESVARENGYNVFLCNANREPDLERHYVDILTERQIDGLIIAGSRLSKEELEDVARSGNAVILTPFVVPGAISYSLDDFKGGQQAGEYLISLGHRNIKFLEGAWRGSTGNRYRGLVSAMKEAGLDTQKVLVKPIESPTTESGRRSALTLFTKAPSTTAVVCYNDVLALGVLQACSETGRKVPDDLTVVGFDDIPEASRFYPRLTTLQINRHQLGVDMMKKLITCIEIDRLNEEHIIFPLQLVKRETCAPPRRSKTEKEVD